jgi:lysophospholipase L1-like esterase
MSALIALGVGLVLSVVLAVRFAGVLDTDVERPRVLVLGDSITDQGQRFVRAEMRASYDLSIDGKASFRIDQQLPSARRWAQRPFSQVVINLGTNDADQGYSVDESTESLTDMVALFADAVCVHLVTLNEQPPTINTAEAPARAIQLNERIRQLAAADPRVRVIDFDSILREVRSGGTDPTEDGIHPIDEVHERLSEAIASSVDTCNVTLGTSA